MLQICFALNVVAFLPAMVTWILDWDEWFRDVPCIRIRVETHGVLVAFPFFPLALVILDPCNERPCGFLKIKKYTGEFVMIFHCLDDQTFNQSKHSNLLQPAPQLFAMVIPFT